MWPESADESDMGLYQNLNIKIDQHNFRAEIFTAATDFNGSPMKMAGLDLNLGLDYTRTPPPAPVQPIVQNTVPVQA